VTRQQYSQAIHTPVLFFRDVSQDPSYPRTIRRVAGVIYRRMVPFLPNPYLLRHILLDLMRYVFNLVYHYHRMRYRTKSPSLSQYYARLRDDLLYFGNYLADILAYVVEDRIIQMGRRKRWGGTTLRRVAPRPGVGPHLV